MSTEKFNIIVDNLYYLCKHGLVMVREFRNPAMDCYQHVKVVTKPGDKTPLANCFIDYTDQKTCYGTIFAIHGYGGAPTDPALLHVKQCALDRGFNFVAIESYVMSYSSRWPIPESDVKLMTMDYYRKSIHAGVTVALRDKKLASGYRIAWAHCLGCRVIVDNYMASKRGNSIFDEFVFVAPYFVPETKLLQTRMRLMQRDPSGQMWNRIANKIYFSHYTLNGFEFHFPKNGHLFDSILKDLPDVHCGNEAHECIDLERYVNDLFKKSYASMADSFNSKLCSCILAESDHIIDCKNTERFYNMLPIKTKSIIRLNGAGHDLENAQEKYAIAIKMILDRTCAYLKARDTILSDLTFSKAL